MLLDYKALCTLVRLIHFLRCIILIPFLKNLETKSEFFSLLQSCLDQYDSLLNSNHYDNERIVKEALLTQFRQPVWDYLAQNCPSFTNRDCQAQLRNIFKKFKKISNGSNDSGRMFFLFLKVQIFWNFRIMECKCG